MKEIGGYFGLEQFKNNEYHADLIAVNSGRNALLYILKAKNIKKIFIPHFLCDTVARLCEREQYEYEFYHIDKDFLPVFNKKLCEGEYLYIVNYYGQVCKEKLLQLKEKYSNIIVDNVQAFFEKPIENIDTVYSCRKFFGVCDGGYVATNARIEEKLSQDVSAERMKHILGRYEKSANEFFAYSQENEKALYNLELKEMSKITRNILGAIDYEDVKAQREKNFKILHSEFGEKNTLNIRVPVGPYAYPLYCENATEIRKALAQKKIYIATLWPNVLELADGLEKNLAKNILPLPVDQRYDENDMQYIIDEVKALI